MKSILTERMETLEDLLKGLLYEKKLIDKTDCMKNKNMQTLIVGNKTPDGACALVKLVATIVIGDKTPDGAYALVKLVPKDNGFHYALREIYHNKLGDNKYFNIGEEDDLILEILFLVDRIENQDTPNFLPYAQDLQNKLNQQTKENICFYPLTKENMPYFLRLQ